MTSATRLKPNEYSIIDKFDKSKLVLVNIEPPSITTHLTLLMIQYNGLNFKIIFAAPILSILYKIA